ncbi:uncharacterized protein LOC129799885 [Phlebotomus papatasi]|uniref:uncharacterized protein LOC129799885 n=1 Tax=Phlebotomus papatasi TaxID=29031 RepID=UPI0024841859|nr:uncharacterized protein LOC129799885 [Phlebotomus papatasi]
MEEIPLEMRAISPDEVRAHSKSISALGLQWKPGEDSFSLVIDTPKMATTKRELTAVAARIFDPLGFLSPVLIVFKMMLQQLWLAKVDWDEAAPEEIVEEYQKILSQYHYLKDVKIPRLIPSQEDTLTLHAFSDASEKAYGAVVYAMGRAPDGTPKICIVIAKSRVATLKPVTIPRMELNAALLLATLVKKVKEAVAPKYVEVQAWVDSTIVLQWLQEHPRKWEKYVAVRTSTIQETIPPSKWRHVPTEDNPADCISRGMLPEDLLQHKLWWDGPKWLPMGEENWPPRKVIEKKSEKVQIPEEKSVNSEVSNVIVLTSQSESSVDIVSQLIEKYSNFMTLIRVVAFVLRFSDNCRKKINERNLKFLSVHEQNRARDCIIKNLQRKHFPEEYKCCEKNNPVSKSSKLSKLVPFIDDNGVMRVKGRLENADLSYETRHPIILPAKDKFVKDLVVFIHEMHLHSGVYLLQSILRAKYWIVGMKSLVKSVVKMCVNCTKAKPKTETPLMGNLPAYRVQPMRPFYHTGCDFAGPFKTRVSKLRKAAIVKSYVCVFICMTTRAMHLEAVSDLSTDAFLAALRRFTARRGHCQIIYCDNATNFVGASGTTREERLQGIRDHQHKITKCMSDCGTEFHFIPSYSPTFGGLWERGVGNVKTHLRRVFGDTILTFEELSTVLAQIEACLNSRPICAMSTEVEDLQSLTPGHFLVGHPLTPDPGPDVMLLNPNRLSRWQFLQRLLQTFWNRWQQEYVTTLQQRPKWCTQSRNLAVGDLVLLRENQLKASRWKMGRIQEVHPGRDNVVRVVTVRTSDGIQKRAASTVAKIPMEENSY